MRHSIGLGLAGLGIVLMADAGQAQDHAPSVHAAMTGLVAPAAQVIWDVANGALDDDGKVAADRITAAQWGQVDAAARRFGAATRLFEMPGLIVAAPGVKLQDEDNPGAANAGHVRAFVEADRAGFAARSRDLREAGLQLEAAAKRQDGKAFAEVADRLDQICESCHSQFWYPEQK